MDWKCRFGWHYWKNWQHLGEGSVTREYGTSGPVLFQETECEKCGAKKRRHVEVK